MRVEIRTGGDGVQCWNSRAIHDYADVINEREGLLSRHNPDLVVISGLVKCYGCEAQEYDYGTKCTAQLTKTVYAVEGEIQPRMADAAGFHREIPGLATIKPGSSAGGETPTRRPAAEPPAPVTPQPKHGAFRGLFGRGT